MYKKLNLLFAVIIIATGVLAYSNSFNCSFHFDDEKVIESSRVFFTNISEVIQTFPNRPVGLLTFAANYQINRLDVVGYHIVNLAIHLINALLIWWLTLITFTTPVMKNEQICKHKTAIAFLAGLLFVTHPLATQSVTYISQRFTSLATMFYLLSLILFVKGRLWDGNRSTALLLFSLSLLSAVSGILTKEIVFTLPFAVVLYDYCFIKNSSWKANIKDKAFLFPALSFLMFILFFFVRFSMNIFKDVPPEHGYAQSISMKEYLFTQFKVILTYIKLFLQPFNQNLDYDYPISVSFFELSTFFSFLALLGILTLGALSFKKYRLISFGIFWFFLTISVESSIIPIAQDVIFEHRTYLPGFGFFLVLTTVFFYFFRSNNIKIAFVILLLIVSINTALTYKRNSIWKNDYTLWGDCIKKSPEKARVNHNYGTALLHIKGDHNQAIAYFDKAINLNKNYADPYNSRGFIFQMLGLYQNALNDYNEAIRLKHYKAEFYINRGFTYLKLGQHQQALTDFNEAIRLKPYKAEAYNNRGLIYNIIGQNQHALEDFDMAIMLKSDYAEPYNNRGLYYYHRGQTEKAIENYNKAIAFKPDYADYYSNRGNAYAKAGQYQLAIADFSYAIGIDPYYAEAYLNRAIAHFDNGYTESACRDANKACDLGNCRLWNVLSKKGSCGL